MNLTKLSINPKSLGKQLLLVDIVPVYTYQNGNKTDVIEGYRYVLALPEHAFEKIGVKIAGEKLIDRPEGYIEVTLDGLELFIYWRNGQYDLGATATGIHAKVA